VQRQQQRQQQQQQAPAAACAPDLLLAQAPPAQRSAGDADQQQERQDLPAVPVAAQKRRRRLTRAAVRADEPSHVPDAAPQLAAVPEDVPIPPAEHLLTQAEKQPAAAAVSPDLAASQHADAEAQPQAADKHATEAAQAPVDSRSRSHEDQAVVVQEAADAVGPEPAAQQQPGPAACHADEQENRRPHPASPPPAKAAARHGPAALTFCAWPHPEQGPCSGASDPCCPPRCSRYQEPAALSAGGVSVSCCRPRRRCSGGWQSWTAAAVRKMVQTQMVVLPRARPAAGRLRSCAVAMVHGRSGSGAEPNSLGTN
jgi:hypothetical protein